MIRAHIATYPPRLQMLEQALATIAPQVDQVFLCLNEFTEIPAFLTAFGNVTPWIPAEDLKDVGKFALQVAADDLVVMADDDLLYDPTHVATLRRIGEGLGLDRVVIGLHGTIYHPGKGPLIRNRTTYHCDDPLAQSARVHQLGTGTILALGRNVAPFDFMLGSQKFVDVRYARWLHDKGLQSWAIERPAGFLRKIELPGIKVETIFKSFTRHSPDHVLQEIRQFANALPLAPGASA
jgi:hypothetical protein